MCPNSAPAIGVVIVPLVGLAERQRHLAAIDDIFFAASATRAFTDAQQSAAFRERWLGRYLVHFPSLAFAAVGAGDETLGYIVGALDDPARDPRFADIGYFRTFARWTARFPAHLHVNLAEGARNRGIGGRLVTAFCEAARDGGAPGVHVVTAEASRNRTFYARLGFELTATTAWNGHAIVLLAKTL